jgi:hypothetical protein
MTGRSHHQGRRMGQHCSLGRDEQQRSACSAMVLSAAAASGCGSVLHADGGVSRHGSGVARRSSTKESHGRCSLVGRTTSRLKWRRRQGRRQRPDRGGSYAGTSATGNTARPANRSTEPGDRVTSRWAPSTAVLMGLK